MIIIKQRIHILRLILNQLILHLRLFIAVLQLHRRHPHLVKYALHVVIKLRSKVHRPLLRMILIFHLVLFIQHRVHHLLILIRLRPSELLSELLRELHLFLYLSIIHRQFIPIDWIISKDLAHIDISDFMHHSDLSHHVF